VTCRWIVCPWLMTTLNPPDSGALGVADAWLGEADVLHGDADAMPRDADAPLRELPQPATANATKAAPANALMLSGIVGGGTSH
jgi:hypothetical protein